MRKRSRGFTLIELMIVVAIVAILAAIAYGAYGRYAYRARRAEGRELIMRVAAAEERYFTNYNAYATSITADPDAGGLGFTSPDSENGYYTMQAPVVAGGTYTLIAAPAGIQATDDCGNLTVDSQGNKSQSGAETNGSCW